MSSDPKGAGNGPDPAGLVLVAGIGNLLLGDDGFGPEVVRRLGPVAGNVRVVDYGIRGLHLAYDLLAGYDALVLVDALPGAGAPGELVLLEIGPGDLGPGGGTGTVDAHTMDLGAVLASLVRLGGRLPPTYLVGCQVASVSAGIGLRPAVAAAVPSAVAAVRDLLERLGFGYAPTAARAASQRATPAESRGA